MIEVTRPCSPSRHRGPGGDNAARCFGAAKGRAAVEIGSTQGLIVTIRSKVAEQHGLISVAQIMPYYMPDYGLSLPYALSQCASHNVLVGLRMRRLFH